MQCIARILLNIDILCAARSAHIVRFDAHYIMFSEVNILKLKLKCAHNVVLGVHTMCSQVCTQVHDLEVVDFIGTEPRLPLHRRGTLGNI